MCKLKKIEAQEICAGKIGSSDINCMAIGTDHLKINNEYGTIEVGENKGLTDCICCGNKNLYFINGILVKSEEVNNEHNS